MGTHDTKSSEKFEQNGRVSLILFIIIITSCSKGTDSRKWLGLPLATTRDCNVTNQSVKTWLTR